jgi:hypothetical protein
MVYKIFLHVDLLPKGTNPVLGVLCIGGKKYSYNAKVLNKARRTFRAKICGSPRASVFSFDVKVYLNEFYFIEIKWGSSIFNLRFLCFQNLLILNFLEVKSNRFINSSQKKGGGYVFRTRISLYVYLI